MKRKTSTLAIDEDEGEEKAEAFNDYDDEDDDDEEDGEDLDQFETDGFIVDYEEERENDQEGTYKQKKEKKVKRRSMEDLILDDDDIELLQENKNSGICQFPKESKKFKRLKKTDDEGMLFDDIFGEEEAASGKEDCKMENFIVDDGESYETSFMRSFKMNYKKLEQVITICSSAPHDMVPSTDDSNVIPNHPKQVKALNINQDNCSEFEPFFLADKYTNERDKCVGETDIPERMQMIEEIAGPPPLDEISIEEESAWILDQLAVNSYLLFCKNRIPERSEEGSIGLSKIRKEDIMKFLELYHAEKFDIPFIAMYRKEQCLSLLDDIEQNEAENEHNDDAGQTCQLKWHKVLWVIKELDKKWLLLKKRKSALLVYYRKCYDEECLNINDSERYTLNKQLFQSILKALKEAESRKEIDDVEAKFRLHFLLAEERMDGKLKRPIKKSQYINYLKAGLLKLASKFGCTSEQLSLQIALEKIDVEFAEHPDESPEEVALNFTCAMFETPALVLEGARNMAALQMSCEPYIRKHVRSIYMDKAVVSTSPTPKGSMTIDCVHKFSGVKWLCDKPLSKFYDAQWLLIQKAEEEKLLQVSIKLPESTLNKLITGFSDVYLIDGAGKSAALWKEQCKLILHDSFSNFLLPSMEKEARDLLTSRAKHWLLMEFGKEFWKKVSVGSYLHNVNTLGSAGSVAPKVMACCWGSGKPETTSVMLDSSGELLDVLEARSFSLRSQNIDEQQRKKNDWQRVFKFVKNHKPDVIVIGAANASCLRLKDDIKEIVSKLEESLSDLGQGMNGISVVFGDESLPQLYEHSQISSDQLPQETGIVKRAVALGRYLQNPLAMVATLCGANKEILSWKLSSLENFLTPDEKYEMIEQVMVDVTNQVGVDINFAMRHDWHFSLLQFVSGLGPQKAFIFQREIVKFRGVNNRKELANGLRTKNIFHNAVGFLCIRAGWLSCSSLDIDLLDDKRIHPESYELAKRLAMAACNGTTEAPLEHVKKEPQVLKSFDLTSFSDNYETEEGENRRETFHHIKMELLHGFLDPRMPYNIPSLEEEFNMICGKNGSALAEGKLIEVIVRHVQPQRAFCVLDCGLTGLIMKDDYSDQDDGLTLVDKMHEGDKISCKIKQIDKSKCQALLTCKESEMKSGFEDINGADPYYQEGGFILLNQQKKACTDEKLGKRHFISRRISHPCFKNMSIDETIEFLSDKDVGESIFHPSPRGPSYLTLTLKVFNELYVHKDIVESGKDGKDITSLLSLGKTLHVGDDAFGNLDEVMDCYVVPVVKHLKEILSFRKFRRGSKEEVDGILRSEKSEYPNRVVYCFGISYEHPGTFILSYIRSVNVHREYVGLLPNGFRFRKRTFEKIEHLVGFFQKFFDGLYPKSQALENLATGNSFRANTDGDYSENRSVSRGKRHSDGDEDGWRKHLTGIPKANKDIGHDSSNDAAKWGNDISLTPNSEDLPGGWSGDADASGGNWGRNDVIRNSEWSNTAGKNPGNDSTSGWGGTDSGNRGYNHGVWHARGNNAGGVGRGVCGDLGHCRRGGCRGGRLDGGYCSSWNDTKEDQSGGSNWGDTKEYQNDGGFGSNEGVWHGNRNSMGGHGYRGGRHGGGRDYNSNWGDTKEDRSGGSFGSNDRVWDGSGSSVGGRGCGGGEHGWNASRGWGGLKETEKSGSFGGTEGARYPTGNSFGGVGRHGGHGWAGAKESENGSFDDNEGAYGGTRDHGSGRGYGGSAGSWNSNRGGRRGDRNDLGRGRGRRGRGLFNDRVDYGQKDSESGPNFSNWGFINSGRKWSQDKKTNLPGVATNRGWGYKDNDGHGDSSGASGKSGGGSSWNSNAGVSVPGSGWEHGGC